MGNETLKCLIEDLEKKQKDDVNEIAKYKALMAKLGEQIQERSYIIKMLTQNNNNSEYQNV